MRTILLAAIAAKASAQLVSLATHDDHLKITFSIHPHDRDTPSCPRIIFPLPDRIFLPKLAKIRNHLGRA